MRFSCDRTGFPWIAVDDLKLEVQLFPVTKIQFEDFLADTAAYDHAWYEEILSVSPRVSWRRFDGERVENIFMTAVMPEEALRYAAWLGEGSDLPAVEEWRAIYRALREREDFEEQVPRSVEREAAVGILQELKKGGRRANAAEGALMTGGVFEWVRDEKGYGALGAPRPEILPNLFDPMTMPPNKPVQKPRHPLFGFRLVRRPGTGGNEDPPR